MIDKKKLIVLFLLINHLGFSQLNNCDSINYKFLSFLKNKLQIFSRVNGKEKTLIYYDNLYNICYDKDKESHSDAESFFVNFKLSDTLFKLKEKINDSLFSIIYRGISSNDFINEIKPWSYELSNGCRFSNGDFTKIFINCSFETWEEFYSNILFDDTLIITPKITIFFRKNNRISIKREIWVLKFQSGKFILLNKNLLNEKIFICPPGTSTSKK
jgi:hypothetical protein